MTTNTDFDLVVIGGGPGGSTAASVVRMRGHRVLLLERERFPRYQIGESLLPSSLGICRLIGAFEAVAEAGFNPKNGGSWYWGDQPAWKFGFGEGTMPLIGEHWAYQVERMRFDDILLNNSRRIGVDVREGCNVEEILEEGGRAVGVRYVDGDRRANTIRARMVVDAGGNSSPFHTLVGTRLMAPRFRNLALFCYFEGGHRDPPPDSGSITVVTFPHGWFWYIPLSATLTSLGAVISVDDAHKLKQGHAEAMAEFIDACPQIKKMLEGAQRITEGIYGQFRVRKDWSYCNTRFWKPGLALVGDAACFVDPLFSSGVHLSMYAGVLAGRSTNSTMSGLPEEVAFLEFEERYRDEYSRFYRFLAEMYDLGRAKEEYFRKAHDFVGQADLTEKQAFVNLVAGFGTDVSKFEFVEREKLWLESPEVVPPPVNPDRSPYAHGQRNHAPSRADYDIEALVGLLEGQTNELVPIPGIGAGSLIPSDDGLAWREQG